MISVFDIFSIGIGPSSSHTVGPMRAAARFIKNLPTLSNVARVQTELYGSLALTGKGHGTDKAVLMGLEGNLPINVDPDIVPGRVEDIINSKLINLGATHEIPFHLEQDLQFHQKLVLPKHANGMKLTAYDAEGKVLLQESYYSIGGGFILREDEFELAPVSHHIKIPYPFDTANQLLEHCRQENLSIAQVMLANESSLQPEQEVKKAVLNIANIMEACINKGFQASGKLPGGLDIKRRAPQLWQKLSLNKTGQYKHSEVLQWLNLFALSVNEENAAGGRVVTAPTNGAAGVIPAVLQYFKKFRKEANDNTVVEFLLTAGAIAILYKKGASISAAEVGCQGEIGVASSMAAGALAAVLGGTLSQIENAAEISMEHHLGLTCDPIHGLVQIPCIERNAMGTVQAVNAACLALMGDGEHFVPLDKVIATMLQTGRDMQSKYKETALGGLAVNLTAC